MEISQKQPMKWEGGGKSSFTPAKRGWGVGGGSFSHVEEGGGAHKFINNIYNVL